MTKPIKLNLTEREWEIGRVLVEELEKWESTEKVSLIELKKLVKRLGKVKVKL